MENFRKKFNLQEKFKNIVVINSKEELEKYAVETDTKYTWTGTEDEWENYINSSKELNYNLKKLLGNTWNRVDDFHSSQPIYNFKKQLDNIALNKYNKTKFKEELNSLMQFFNLNKNDNTDNLYKEILTLAEQKSINNKYVSEGITFYSNFFNERESEIKFPNTIGLGSELSKLKFSYDNPDRNLLIINCDVKLDKNSVFDVYGNVIANNFEGGLFGARSVKAKNIKAMKMIATNIESESLVVNPQGNKLGFESMFYDLTFKNDVSEEIFNSLKDNPYDKYDILVGDIEIIEPSILDSFNIGLQDAKDGNAETFVNVEFENTPNFKGGILNVRDDLVGSKIWAKIVSANRIVCKDVLAGSEANNYNVPLNEIRELYESQKGYKFKDLVVSPLKTTVGSTINANWLTCENADANYIKCVNIICDDKLNSNYIDVDYMTASEINSDSINSNEIIAKTIIADEVSFYKMSSSDININKQINKKEIDNDLKGLRSGVKTITKKMGMDW